MDQKTNITICCPSRGRPELAQRMALTALETADDPDQVNIQFYLNNDDPELPTYQKLLQNYQVGSDQSPVYSWNQLAEQFDSHLYMLAGDDIQFMTHGWDSRFMQQFDQYPDGVFCISFKNGIDELTTAPHPVVTKQWQKALGFYFPFVFYHWYVDTYTKDLAESVNRYIYLADITVKAKKITKDSTAQKIRTNGIPQRDAYTYQQMKKCYFESDVQKLKKAIQYPYA